jgi:DNA-binding phage protein
MALTRSYKETLAARLKKDRGFREALLREAIEVLLSGEVDTGKAVLRDYINATIGFEKLSAKVKIPPKSLMRMFGPRGNPQAKNLFAVIHALQKNAGMELHVAAG